MTQTAAIIDGTVDSIEYDYTPEKGPRTQVWFRNLTVLRGNVTGPVKIDIAGGYFPDGRFLVVSGQPEFVEGQRYVVMLRNTAWRYSPVLSGGYFKVVQEEGREILVAEGQGAVVGVSANRIRLSKPLFLRQDRGPAARAVAIGRTSESVPSAALNVQRLVQSFDAQLRRARLQIRGEFFDEPSDRATATTRSAPPTNSQGERGTNTEVEADESRPAKKAVDERSENNE